MFDEKKMIKAFLEKCEQVVEECAECHTPSDVQDVYETFCEAVGMELLFEAGWGVPLHVKNQRMAYSLNVAWSCWLKTSNRICYDPETGYRLEGC